jgi:hypothetical protein
MRTTRLGWGLIGAGTTMLVRNMTRRAMHDRRGDSRLPDAARRDISFRTMLLLAAAAGVMLALGDVLHEQRQHVTHVA